LFLLVLAAPVAVGASQPTLVIAPQLRAEVATELDFHVQVDSTNPVPADCSIIITGLPKSVTFSAGSAIATGVWEVPVLALDRLKMVVPAGETSSSILIIFLAVKKKDLVILASARSFLFIQARTEDARPEAEAWKAEEERLAEAKRAEAARSAELAKAAEDARGQVAAKKAEDVRQAEARKADVTRVVEEAEAATKVARQYVAAKMAEDERLAEAKRAEARAAELEKAADDVRRQAAAKIAEDERLAEARKAEAAKSAEAAKVQDGRRQAGVARAGASTPMVAALSAEQEAAAIQQETPAFAQLERLLERGDRYLDQGNIQSARQFFLRAAQSGLAAAAFKLAETHDPHELARRNVRGLKPDPAEAKRWYARASDLGVSEAKARLGRLGD
jgi:TPR repeat protein